MDKHNFASEILRRLSEATQHIPNTRTYHSSKSLPRSAAKIDDVEDPKIGLPSANQRRTDLSNLPIGLDSQPAHGVRIIHFSKEDSLGSTAKYRLICRAGGEKTEIDMPISCPTLRFDKISWNDPWRFIFEFEERSTQIQPEFIDWFKKNLIKYGKHFAIIVYNESDRYDLAWELIHVHINEEESKQIGTDLTEQVPIGALATIAHWVPGLQYYERKKQPTIADSMTAGHVVAYVDNDMEADKQALKRFIHHSCIDFDELEGRLREGLDGTGLIYVASHGTFDTTQRDIKAYIGLQQGDYSKDASLNYYILADLKHLNDSIRPIVIVNACFSALYFCNEDGYPVGLPVSFLRMIAKAYIGCMNRVGNRHAKYILEQLSCSIFNSANRGAPIASVLRDLRSDAFRTLRKWRGSHVRDSEKGHEVALDFIDTFMYIYFGNPLERLHLIPASEEN